MKTKTQGTVSIIAALFVLFTALANPIAAVFIGAFCLAALGIYCYAICGEQTGILQKRNLLPDSTQREKEHLLATLELARETGSVNSHEIRELLGVADAVAGGYLSKLEMEGKLTQVGDSGRYALYNPGK